MKISRMKKAKLSIIVLGSTAILGFSALTGIKALTDKTSDAGGAMLINVSKPLFDPEGLVTKEGKTVFFSQKGMPETGWHTIDGKTYYFSSDNFYALTGKQTIEGIHYLFDENGVLSGTWKEEKKQETAGTTEVKEAEASGTENNTSAEAEQPAVSAPGVPYDTGNLGSAGNLSIPGLGVDVALNYVDMTSAASDPQGVVNAANSAAYMTGFTVPVIADHAAQGFSAIASAYGQTACIYNGSSVTAYRCVGVYSGTNTGDDILVNGQSAICNAMGSLVMYTCQSADGVNVYVSVWDYA